MFSTLPKGKLTIVTAVASTSLLLVSSVFAGAKNKDKVVPGQPGKDMMPLINIKASNGVIHVIDTVMLPIDPTPPVVE